MIQTLSLSQNCYSSVPDVSLTSEDQQADWCYVHSNAGVVIII